MSLKHSSTVPRNNDVLSELMVEEDFDDEFMEDIIVEKSEKKTEEQTVANEDMKSGADEPSVSEVNANPENVPSQMVRDIAYTLLMSKEFI